MNSFLLAIRPAILLLALATMQAEDRLPPIPAAKMDSAQKAAAAEVSPAGGNLPGWLVALSRSPQVMVRVKSLGDYVVREKKTLNPQLTELVILVVAREWTQQYLWHNHRLAAIRTGLSEKIVDAIAKGETPAGMTEDQQAAYDFSVELLKRHEVSDATWARAVGRFGEEGVIDAEGLMGYYTILAMAMNSGHTPLENGAKPELAPLR